MQTKENQCKHGKTFLCKRLNMMEWLADRGHLPFKTQREKANPKFFNWIYLNTPQLERDVELWFSMQHKR